LSSSGWQHVKRSARASRLSRSIWRVVLREPAPSDAVEVNPWLSEALAAVAGRSLGEAAPLTLAQLTESLSPLQRLLLITSREAERSATGTNRPLGLIKLSNISLEPVRIDALAIAGAERNLGYGAEAVYELEELYPNVRLIAGVPVTNGLAIYFWLRVGYRPLFPVSADIALSPGRVWMERGALPSKSVPNPLASS